MDRKEKQSVPTEPLKTAVLFLVFNRPHNTAHVFEAIRRTRPPRLYIAADGPRRNRPDDVEKVKAVREYLMSHVDWDCEVKTLLREENLGCKHAVSSAITWFFDNEEMGIILEDDCLPSQSFFRFCEELLERFKEDSRVMKIAGYSLLDGRIEYPFSYYFGHIGFSWGWASWRRAWKHFDLGMSDWPDFKALAVHRVYPFTKMRNRTFEQTFQGKIDTWDYQWDYAVAKNHGLSVIPVRSLVRNIGFGKDATHSPENGGARALIKNNECPFPLRHPRFVFPQGAFDNMLVSMVKKETSFYLLHRAKDKAKSFLAAVLSHFA